MSSQEIGALLWISLRPMLRLVLSASAGFIITKANILSPVAARGAAQIVLNIGIPSLFVSKIIPAFTPQNVGNLGPIVLVCLLYGLIGLLTCLLALSFFWVPHRFRWGFIVAGIWGNYGDLPAAVIMSVTASAPFNGTHDQDLAIGYIAGFVLVAMLTFFPMGGHLLVAKDFTGPDKADDDIPHSVIERTRNNMATFTKYLRATISYTRRWNRAINRRCKDVEGREDPQDTPAGIQQSGEMEQNVSWPKLHSSSQSESSSQRSEKVSWQKLHSSSQSEFSQRSWRASFIKQGLAPAGSNAPDSERQLQADISLSAKIIEDTKILANFPQAEIASPSEIPQAGSSAQRESVHTWHLKTVEILRNVFTLPTTIIVSAFIISTIQPAKALFVPLSDSPKTPGGQPPLAFVMDTATFLGGASVPLGLICLGSSLAQLKIPNGQWRKLPIGAIISLSVARLIIQPVLGVMVVQGLTKVKLISAEDKVLRFVCMFIACVPTSTTQVFLTQAYSGTGSADLLAAFLIPQLFLTVISSTAMTAYSLHLLFK